MSRHYKTWTKQEEAILRTKVKHNPGNLTKAYKAAAIELGRTQTACKIHWEKVCSKQGICFVLYGNRGTINRKNTQHYSREQSKIISFLKGIIAKLK